MLFRILLRHHRAVKFCLLRHYSVTRLLPRHRSAVKLLLRHRSAVRILLRHRSAGKSLLGHRSADRLLLRHHSAVRLLLRHRSASKSLLGHRSADRLRLRHHSAVRLWLRHRSAASTRLWLRHRSAVALLQGWQAVTKAPQCCRGTAVSTTRVLIAVIVVPYHPVPHSYHITVGFFSPPLPLPSLSLSLPPHFSSSYYSFPLLACHMSDGDTGAMPVAGNVMDLTAPLESPVPESIPLIPAPPDPIRHSSGSPLTSVHGTSVLTHLTEAAPLMAAATVPAPQPQQPGPPTPLTLSTAFAPIGGKVVESIQSGAYVDFKSLLWDNVELKQRLQELGIPAPYCNAPGTSSRLREVQDPLTWVRCFLLYLAARVDHQHTRELAAYAVTVIDLARAHGGQGWRLYDTRFRQQKAAGGLFPWSEINSSIMANTIFPLMGSSQGQACELCFTAGHTKHECALYSMELQKKPQQDRSTSYKPTPPQSYGRPPICKRFNRNLCYAPQCRFDHICSHCKKPGHPASECLTKKNSALATTGK